jgi:hypothetical protein
VDHFPSGEWITFRAARPAIRFLQELKFSGVRVIYISQNIDSASEQAETLVAVQGVVDSPYLRPLEENEARSRRARQASRTAPNDDNACRHPSQETAWCDLKQVM